MHRTAWHRFLDVCLTITTQGIMTCRVPASLSPQSQFQLSFLLWNMSFWKFSSVPLNGEHSEVRNELEFPEAVRRRDLGSLGVPAVRYVCNIGCQVV